MGDLVEREKAQRAIEALQDDSGSDKVRLALGDALEAVRALPAAQPAASSVETLERVHALLRELWQESERAFNDAREAAMARQANKWTHEEVRANGVMHGVSCALSKVEAVMSEAEARAAQPAPAVDNVSAVQGERGSLLRCAVCGWVLADEAKNGCVPGNCSMRPRPSPTYAEKLASAAQPAPVFNVGDRVRLKRDIVRDGNGEYLSIPREDVDRLASELSAIKTISRTDGKIGVTLVLSNGHEWGVYTDDIEPAPGAAPVATDHAELLRELDDSTPKNSGDSDLLHMSSIAQRLAAAIRAEVERRQEASRAYRERADRLTAAEKERDRLAQIVDSVMKLASRPSSDRFPYMRDDVTEAVRSLRERAEVAEARVATIAADAARIGSQGAAAMKKDLDGMRAALEAERKAHEETRQKEDGALAEAERDVEQLRAQLAALNAPIVLDDAFAEELARIGWRAMLPSGLTWEQCSPANRADWMRFTQAAVGHVLQRMRARLVSEGALDAFNAAHDRSVHETAELAPTAWAYDGMRAAIGSHGQAGAAADEDPCPVPDELLERWSKAEDRGTIGPKEYGQRGLAWCVRRLRKLGAK